MFNDFYSPETSPTAKLLLSLDACNALDQIEYECLLTTSERFGFEPTFHSVLHHRLQSVPIELSLIISPYVGELDKDVH